MKRKLKPRLRRRKTRHHLLPKSRGGDWGETNILELWNDHHEVWHWLFGNRNLQEIIEVLQRLQHIKEKK